MGRPVDDPVEVTKDDHEVADFSFSHTPSLYGSLFVVVLGAFVAFAVATINDFLNYPTERKAQLLAANADFFEVIPSHSVLEVLATGFMQLASIVWLPIHDKDDEDSPWRLWKNPCKRSRGVIYFSDCAQNTVYKWQEGQLSVHVRPAGYTGQLSYKYLVRTVTGKLFGPAGLAVDSDGQLAICQHGDRRIVQMTDALSFKTLVDENSADNVGFNSPHRLIYRSNGDFYFTDPPLGLAHGADSVHYVGYSGLYMYSHITGRSTLLSANLTVPTGLELSPDERQIYVTDGNRILYFSLLSDGSLANPKVPDVLYQSDKESAFVGIIVWTLECCPALCVVDSHHRLYVAGDSGIVVIRSDGTVLGTIELDAGDRPQDLTWDTDEHTLYIVTQTRLMRLVADPHSIV